MVQMTRVQILTPSVANSIGLYLQQEEHTWEGDMLARLMHCPVI